MKYKTKTEKRTDETDRPEDIDGAEVFGGRLSLTETVAFVCNTALLLMFVSIRLFYGEGAPILIAILGAIEIYLFIFCMLPERYGFSEDGLVIRRKFRKAELIPYDSVFNCDASLRDSFLNVTARDTVKVYYQRKKGRSVAICRPRNAERFVETLKRRCPEFSEEESNTELNVFFDKK